MMNIQDNEVMVLGGRPGQFFDKWDDKTFVYSWGKNAQTIADNGKWIGISNSSLIFTFISLLWSSLITFCDQLLFFRDF